MRARHGNGHSHHALIELVFQPDTQKKDPPQGGPSRRIPIRCEEEGPREVVPWRVIERDSTRS
ncbi:MAG: hypothetical protein ACLFV7_00535 [Phycisphaerae bacterium]